MDRKTCAFCQRTDRKISNEHVWPTWLKAILPDRSDLRVELRRGERALSTWKVPPDDLGITINEICRDCNHGWMETKVEKPFQAFAPALLRAEQGIIDPDRAKVLATWIYKHALVFDLLNSIGRRTFTKDDRYAFHLNPRVPHGGFVVWCAPYDGRLLSTARATHRSASALVRGSEQIDVSYLIGTALIGFLAFAFVAYEAPGLPAPQVWIPDLAGAAAQKLRLLWPILHSYGVPQTIYWPPPPLTDADLPEFRDLRRLASSGSIYVP